MDNKRKCPKCELQVTVGKDDKLIKHRDKANGYKRCPYRGRGK